ncbi:hypothetical protein RRF57_011172 [Xylaria bambusicola]|uniref:Uncharacterized protein n=1 Tax=Xylaria bambusicola TaxID=326684 RepID=A0AAN7UMC5_9PEZI
MLGPKTDKGEMMSTVNPIPTLHLILKGKAICLSPRFRLAAILPHILSEYVTASTLDVDALCK